MCRFNGFADPRHFLRFAVIHNDDMARMQLGGQDLVDVAAKHITVCATSTVIVATSPYTPIVPIIVMVRPRLCGLAAYARCPRGAHA